MKLYYIVGSPNCRKVHAVIEHLGLTIDFEYLSFFSGDLKTPEFLQKNPNGMVPVLVDEELTLWESNAIMQYLADTVPNNALFPHHAKKRADIHRWQCWELAHYNKALGVLSFETVAKPSFMGMAPDPAAVAWSQAELARHARTLEVHLTGKTYLTGDEITLADYSLVHLEGFKEASTFDWSPYPQVNAYYERMRQAPAWLKTAPSSPEAIGRIPSVKS